MYSRVSNFTTSNPFSTQCNFLGEEYFSVPLQVTRRKLAGMCDSLVASSVWSSEFKKTLKKYPELTLIRMRFSSPGCHACRLGGRTSTLLARLSGAPYDECDFEVIFDFLPVAETSLIVYQDLTDEESDGSESHTSAEDSDKGSLARRKEFHLGRFCAARTRVYHEFNHWEVHQVSSGLMTIVDPTSTVLALHVPSARNYGCTRQ